MKKKVYLAGAISGLTFNQSIDWREDAIEKLNPEIEGFSPLRAKGYLQSVGVITQSYAIHPLSSDRGIMTRDHFDVMSSDAVLVNLLNTTERSIGTIMEIAWAFAYRKPLIVAMEKEKNPHEHPMIREAIGFRFDNLDEAIYATKAILLPVSHGTTLKAKPLARL